MELKAVRTREVEPGRIRVIGEIAYDDRPGSTEECWFDFPAELADTLCKTGSPWLACMLPLAATLGEPLRIPLPVDRVLYRNALELLHIWHLWWPKLRVVDVIADVADEAPVGNRSASFFSGGVDAFFTLLHNEEKRPGALPVDDLICVGGFDIPLRNIDAFHRLRDRLRGVASRLGKTLIDVVTNLRETRLEESNWYDVLHGPAPIAIGLMLGSRYERLMIASAGGYGSVEHSGTHPMTDPLLSTSRTQVVHDGARFNRVQKTAYVGANAIAREALHVCWADASDTNCGTCEKCVRTMTALQLAGLLEGIPAFPSAPLLPLLRRLYLSRAAMDRVWMRTARHARATGQRDIAREIRKCVWRSRIRRPLIQLSKALQKQRLLWRIARPMKRWLQEGTIH